MKPIMISFSGIDSAGKSTYIDLLKEHFDQNEIRYKVVWSRGGYTSIFEVAKKIFRTLAGKKLPESGHSKQRDRMFQKRSVAAIWYIIAMIDLIRLYAFTFRIYKLLGYTVICDRYIWDTYVDFSFQFSVEKIQKSILWRILEITYRKPDISLFLYITPEESLRRSTDKNEPFSEPLDKRQERIKVYNILDNGGKWSSSICTENKSIHETWREIEGNIDNALF